MTTVPELNASAILVHRRLDKTNADVPTVTVNTMSVHWQSIIASAAHALFVVMRDQ